MCDEPSNLGEVDKTIIGGEIVVIASDTEAR